MGLLVGVVSALLAIVLTLIVYIAVDIYRLPKSRFYESRDLLRVYLTRRLISIVGRYKWRTFQKDTRNFIKAQERYMLRQIRNNENTAYGRDHQFQRIHSLADFRRLHPVTDYYHYAKYIEKAEKGDTKALLGKDTIVMFACSSGTTGKAKHIPVSTGCQWSFADMLGALRGFFPERFQGPMFFKEMQVMCVPRWQTSECGIPIGPLSGMFMKNRSMMTHWSTPFEAVVVDTEAEALYVSLLFGLRDRNLAHIEGSFAAGFFNVLKFMEDNWQDLVADVQSGRLKESLNIGDDNRQIINKFLVPDPERARELETEFKKGTEGILKRIFPVMKSVNVLSSGTSMALYKKRCAHFVKGIDMVSPVYGSSEGFMGVNMRPMSPDDPAYALVPSMALVEFLPVDETGSPIEGQEPILADEVKIGQLYEIVLTNCSGFYRYRLGDVVKVVDFYNQAPALDFQFRAGQLLNVHMEKLSEESFFGALQTALASWPGVVLRDFTSAESVLDPSPRPGAPYYLVFLELERGEVSQDQLGMIDAALCEQNYVYKSFRVKDSIAPMKVMLVEKGGFTAFRQFTFDTTTAYLGQFKQPRVLRTSKQVEFFMKHLTQQQ